MTHNNKIVYDIYMVAQVLYKKLIFLPKGNTTHVHVTGRSVDQCRRQLSRFITSTYSKAQPSVKQNTYIVSIGRSASRI